MRSKLFTLLIVSLVTGLGGCGTTGSDSRVYRQSRISCSSYWGCNYSSMSVYRSPEVGGYGRSVAVRPGIREDDVGPNLYFVPGPDGKPRQTTRRPDGAKMHFFQHCTDNITGGQCQRAIMYDE